MNEKNQQPDYTHCLFSLDSTPLYFDLLVKANNVEEGGFFMPFRLHEREPIPFQLSLSWAVTLRVPPSSSYFFLVTNVNYSTIGGCNYAMV